MGWTIIPDKHIRLMIMQERCKNQHYSENANYKKQHCSCMWLFQCCSDLLVHITLIWSFSFNDLKRLLKFSCMFNGIIILNNS